MKDTILTLISVVILIAALALLASLVISTNGLTAVTVILVTGIVVAGLLTIRTLLKTCHFGTYL